MLSEERRLDIGAVRNNCQNADWLFRVSKKLLADWYLMDTGDLLTEIDRLNGLLARKERGC